MPEALGADEFLRRLEAHRSAEEREKYRRYFKAGIGEIGGDDYFLGIRMGQVFALAKDFIELPLGEIETLLESPVHEARAGGMSIMNQQARRPLKKTPESRRKELFDLLVRRHDRVNNWDLVDLGAPYVVGGYLWDKPPDLLYRLAVSENQWERRTAVVSTAYFIMKGEVDDTLRIAELLLSDPEDLVHKAAGGWLREAGRKDRPRLLDFLDRHAAAIPRTMLRYAIVHLDDPQRAYYRSRK